MRKPKIKSNVAYHIYNRAASKKKLFLSKSDYDYFEFKIKVFKAKYNIEVISHCLMPTHFHLLVKTDSSEKMIGKFMKSLQLSYALYSNAKYKRSGHVFESAYKHKEIDTAEYLSEAIDYIRENPVRKGLVMKAEHWPYSS
jgi:putative transposase